MKTGFFAVAFAILRKDLIAEVRSREIIGVMGLYALLAVIIFSFALELDRIARQEAIAGVLWVTVTFASILGLNRSMNSEREQGNIDAMLLAPIDRAAIFLGKFLGNFLLVLVVGLVLLPLMTILYNINMISLWMVGILVLGTFGICSTGTLLSAMTVQTRARDALLPIALLPVVLPVLMAAVKASTAILADAPLEDWQSWPQILLVINVIYFVLCYFVFEYAIEE